MTLDSGAAWIPHPVAMSAHSIDIKAEPEEVFDVLIRADFGRSPIVKLLMGLRSVPAWFAHRPNRSAPSTRLLGGAFATLVEHRPHALVLGLTGRFWTPSGGLVPTAAATFHDPLAPHLGRAVWAFNVHPVSTGVTRLATETRVMCGGPDSTRAFLHYWRFVHFGSGLIRRAILRQIKRDAEISRERRS